MHNELKRGKSPFWEDNAHCCSHQSLKSMFFEKISSGGSQRRAGVKEKFQINVDFSLLGNDAIIHRHICKDLLFSQF